MALADARIDLAHTAKQRRLREVQRKSLFEIAKLELLWSASSQIFGAQVVPETLQ